MRQGLAASLAVGTVTWRPYFLALLAEACGKVRQPEEGLPVLAEACLWAGEIDRAEGVGLRLRRHSEQLDHKLGVAWADTCDALVRWKRGDPRSAVALMRQAAAGLESIPMIPYSARLRRQMAGRLIDLDMQEEAFHELNRVHEMNCHMGAELELQKTRQMYRELEPPRPAPRCPRACRGRSIPHTDIGRSSRP